MVHFGCMGKLIKQVKAMLRIASADISTVRIFKTKQFRKWANRQGIKDTALIDAVQEISDGTISARLSGSLVKQRIATGNKGKRGGTRAIIAYRVKDKFFFLHGFAKNEKSTTDPKEDRVLKELGAHFLSLTNTQIQTAIDNFELYEVTR